ncbi:conserved hypothetical protein [Paraburkholderia tropica]|uniref:hypothetical protein n=1 Tax=Paraburkholderia tropica TaxID=92647 RepID=UPI001CB4F016|nr:hypothetical protein [Paraburkholderia tropica]CAG9236052.1 conserved hypothetical protein [Paraburkholderia tropica]
MMKRNFEGGLVVGFGLGASTVMLALAACIGSKLVMGLGAAAIVAGIAMVASLSRVAIKRG